MDDIFLVENGTFFDKSSFTGLKGNYTLPTFMVPIFTLRRTSYSTEMRFHLL